MNPTDPALAAALARARDERRRRLAGSLDAVALTRSNTTRASRAIAEHAQRRSAELDPPPAETPAEVDRGGWGPRPTGHDGGILRPVHGASSPQESDGPSRPRDDEAAVHGQEGEEHSWLR